MRTEDIPPHWRKLPEKQALTGGGTPWCALQGHFSYMIGILPEIHFQQLLEFYLIKKYTTNEEAVPTLTTQYILHVQSSHTNVNQVFQNCHVCIFFLQMFESAPKSWTKGEEAQWLGSASSQSCGKKGQLAYSLIQWSARTGAFRGESCPSNNSLQNYY